MFDSFEGGLFITVIFLIDSSVLTSQSSFFKQVAGLWETPISNHFSIVATQTDRSKSSFCLETFFVENISSRNSE